MTEVAAALIENKGRFMICQRPAHKARGLLWEFVGGKVEPGETKQALVRECREELAVTADVGDVFMDVTHEYPDLTVLGQIVSGILTAVYLRRFQSIRLTRECLIPRGKLCLKLCSLGVSRFFLQLAAPIVIAVMNNVLVKYGAASRYGTEIPMITLGITMKINQIITGIVIGIAVGSQPIIGCNYAQGRWTGPGKPILGRWAAPRPCWCLARPFSRGSRRPLSASSAPSLRGIGRLP